METQVETNMTQTDFPEKSTKDQMVELTEEQFLKNLYVFMKKRDTPIERIPNLGFKQIDLFVMYKTVCDLGGYHQVTSHQLWKRVYNALGGNPRSTSAATCTRRHYEKLLLPYECHLKGILMSTTTQHQPKSYRYTKDDDSGQRPSKRRLLSLQLHQGSHSFQSDPHESVYPMPLIYPHYYHPVPQPYVPIPASLLTPHPSVPKPRFPFQPSQPDSTDTVKEPLELLRYLAEQYKTSAGLTEPLNLSVKESNISPVSSFSPPSSSKNPKFLNKPSTLYSPHHTGSLRDEACEAQDHESNEEVLPFSEPVKEKEMNAVDMKASSLSVSPVNGFALTTEEDKDVIEIPQKQSSPKTDFPIKPAEDREVYPVLEQLNLSHVSPKEKEENEDKMEIEVPLSVFRNWLKLCGSSTKLPNTKEPLIPDLEVSPGKRRWSDLDIFHTDLTCHSSSPNQSLADDLRLKKEPNPISNSKTTSPQCGRFQSHFINPNLSSSGGVSKNVAGQEVWPFKQQSMDNPYPFKSPDLWGTYDRETPAPSEPSDIDSSPLRPQDLASKFYVEDPVLGVKQRLEMEPSAVLMVNSSPASVLHLTNEEVMKLKKIISNSS